jgi:Protein of unknown function (DUF1329)
VKLQTKFSIAVVAAASAGCAMAAVSAEEAKALGTTLTYIGAQKEGNKEGTIPAFTGEGVKPPANYDPKEPFRRPDPFANEKPLFSITAQNAAQYADKLDAMVEMFKVYPNFRMDVYPSHRTGIYPKAVVENTFKNATSCKGTDGDIRIEGCWGGFAFPIPKNGAQVMWNHLTNYESFAWGGYSDSWVIANNGTASLIGGNLFWQQSKYFDPSNTAPSKGNTTYWEVRVDSVAPARRVGEKLVLIDPLDVLTFGRRAYQYIPGQRRVKLAPDLAYDTPSPNAGGAATMDDAKTFLGSIDRYDWKLMGKKEKYIMYNNFKATEHTTCTNAVINTKNFANPDCVRWELHRVWVVQATIKPGYRHIYPKRTFYWDEDGYAAGLSENYDAGGKLYRVVSSVAFPFYSTEGGGTSGDGTFNYDLQTGVWSSQGSWADKGAGLAPQTPHTDIFYASETLAGEGIR